jgi:hypothetical protein
MASDPELQLGLMKLLATKHFPLQSPRPKLKLEKLLKALERVMGSPPDADTAFENLTELKGRGYVNTEPKIIMKDELDSVEFEIWLTPLGRTELGKKLAAS